MTRWRKNSMFNGWSLIIIAQIGVVISLASSCNRTNSEILADAVLAKEIPIYPGAIFVGAIGGATSEDEIDGAVVMKGKAWLFTIDDPMEEVQAYYQEKLPDAKMTIEKHEPDADEDGNFEEDQLEGSTAGGSESRHEILFSLTPQAPLDENEEISISIVPGQLIVSESYKPERVSSNPQ